MKAKYDIARLHKDCLAWCENPEWKPWMVDDYKLQFVIEGINLCIKDATDTLVIICSNFPTKDVLLFGQIIGLDVESYRLPEIDRDQAVRDYLDSIPSGGELADGWIKTVSLHTGATFAEKSANRIRLMNADKVVDPITYTFLRLDLREDKQ